MFTDNNPLTNLLTMAKLNATDQRWMASLTNYNFKLHHKSSKLNVEADALSRISWGQEEELHTLINNKALWQYVGREGNSSGMRVLLKKVCSIEKSC